MQGSEQRQAGGPTHNNTVLPGEEEKLIETGDKVPASSDVASYEDAEGEDGEGVHRALLLLAEHAAFAFKG